MDYPSIFQSTTNTIFSSRTREAEAKTAFDALTSVCLYADEAQAAPDVDDHAFYYRMYFEVNNFRKEYGMEMEIQHRRISACEKLLAILPNIKDAVAFAQEYHRSFGRVPIIDNVWTIADFWYDQEPIDLQLRFVPDPNNQDSILLSVEYDREVVCRSFYTDGEISFSVRDEEEGWMPPHENDLATLGELFEKYYAELNAIYREG